MHNNFRWMQQIAWTRYVTIVRTEVRRFMRIKAQTFVPPVITMVLYLYIFCSIGRKVGSILTCLTSSSSARDHRDGIDQ